MSIERVINYITKNFLEIQTLLFEFSDLDVWKKFQTICLDYRSRFSESWRNVSENSYNLSAKKSCGHFRSVCLQCIRSVWHLPPPEFQQLSVIPVYPSAKLALHYNHTDPTRSNVSRRGGPWRRRYAHRIHFSWALECRPTKLSAPPHRFTPMRAPVSLLISHYTLSLDRDVPGGSQAPHEHPWIFRTSPTSGASRVLLLLLLLLAERLVDLLCNDEITRVYRTVESV